MIIQNRVANIPSWLENLISKFSNGVATPFFSNFALQAMTTEDVIRYFQMYTPRSFATSYCVFAQYFTDHISYYSDKESLNVFDFGCGSGGNIIGLLEAIKDYCSNVKVVNVTAIDGNESNVLLCNQVLNLATNNYPFKLRCNTQYYFAASCSDLIAQMPHDLDVIMACKVLNEIFLQRAWGQTDFYTEFIKYSLKRTVKQGLVFICDIASKADVPLCPVANVANATCLLNIHGRCAVNDYANFINVLAGNNSINSSNCSLKLFDVWYRDLMWNAKSRCGCYAHNLWSHSSESSQERYFKARFSNGNVVTDGAYWMLCRNDSIDEEDFM